MNETWFEIKVRMPVALTQELAQNNRLNIDFQPRWRFLNFNLQLTEPETYLLRLQIHGDDINRNTSEDELWEFRDRTIDLLAFCFMVPIELKSAGRFDFALEDGKGRFTSLTAPENSFSTAAYDISPIILAMKLDPKYWPVLHFLSEVLNSKHPLYRFINIAIAIDLIARHDSPISHSRYPTCTGTDGCGHELKECPKCKRAWAAIPSTLREKIAFLIPDKLRSKFITARNRVMHGLGDDPHAEAEDNLTELNFDLLILIRNYLGRKVGLPPLEHQTLTTLSMDFRVSATVDYIPKVLIDELNPPSPPVA